MASSFCSGDGGNRTRVRKIRPLNIYKLSRPFVFNRRGPGQRGPPPASRLSPKGLLAASIDVEAAHVDSFVASNRAVNERDD
jgi:hypothetical protein